MCSTEFGCGEEGLRRRGRKEGRGWSGAAGRTGLVCSRLKEAVICLDWKP